MSTFRYQFPRIGNVDSVTVDNTPVSGTTDDLAAGTMTILNTAGNESLVVRASDFISYRYEAYAAGTPHAVNVTLTGITLVSNSTYTLTVSAPNVINFFGGGRETGAVYQTRTYNVASASTATVDGIGASLAAAITADPGAYFTATYTAGTDVLLITALSAEAGALEIVMPAGATKADATAFVAPVGKASELVAYGINATEASGAGYNRFIIRHRKLIRSNAVSGLQVFAPVNSLVYLDKDNAGTSATVTSLTAILAGTSTAADYLGCPSV